ncbi:MAG: hypothetical protein JWQ42_1607 [Edaphobacter sp.]|nr:hypothetical protein [Edaphobacter sp.]
MQELGNVACPVAASTQGTHAARSTHALAAHGSPHNDAVQGLEVSLRDVLQHQFLQAQVRHQTLQLRVLKFKFLQPSSLVNFQPVTITQDLTRVMSRIKALYRSWAIPCSGTSVYAPRHRAEWLGKIPEPGVRLRAERLYQQLDLLQSVRQQARRDLLSESRKHHAVKLLRQIPSIGPIRGSSRRT